MKEAIVLLLRWLPVLQALYEATGGNKRRAMAKIRKWELEQREARDRRMRRGTSR